VAATTVPRDGLALTGAVRLFDDDASTSFPLFWFTSPLFKAATFGPLMTIGSEVAVWSAELLPLFD
jgi:hypothetical protein